MSTVTGTNTIPTSNIRIVFVLALGFVPWLARVEFDIPRLGTILFAQVAVLYAVVVFYLFFGVISASREHLWPILNYLQAIWLHLAMLGIVVALVLFGCWFLWWSFSQSRGARHLLGDPVGR